VLVHLPPCVSLDLPVGSRLSLFPLMPVTGHSEGLYWPVDGIEFSPGGRSGTSNEVSGPVRLEMDRPGMLLILPREALVSLLSALSRLQGSWPAL
jgi:thiamine pyrophosphokinase